jgi:MoaA/NifB/PqqE/SkfB family radical SAM enzyme
MPFLHLHVGNEGYVKACCVANINFGNINKQSLPEIWNDKPITELREKFKKGERDKRCAVCYKLEEAGGKSIRQETFEKFPNFNYAKPSLPIYFDIRFSNVCNYRCRTCWHGASSKWFQEAKILKTNSGEKAIIKNIEDFEAFILKCGESLLHAEEIYFAGGEPLATEEHYLLLDWLVTNNATSVKLRYNTNFSLLKFKSFDVLDYWSKFKSVEILASIDASEKLGEYIRKEMKWETILLNREKARSIPHLKVKISPTVSVMNMMHLPDLYKECLKNKFIEKDGLYINILDRPMYYNIQIFPQEVKKQIIDKYSVFFEWMKENSIPKSIENKFKECLEYMLSEDKSRYWRNFLIEAKKIDDLRNEKTKDVLGYLITK